MIAASTPRNPMSKENTQERVAICIDGSNPYHYVGFFHKPTLGFQKHATESRLLIKEELEPFVFRDLISKSR